MSKDEMRIAIAEACGWKRRSEMDGYSIYDNGTIWAMYPDQADYNKLPNYPEDLNACFQVREQLGLHKPENQAARVKWASCLRKALEPFAPVNKVGSPLISDIDCSTASAAIHAEAIARYLGVFH